MNKICRVPCPECPWTNENKHNVKFQIWSDRMLKLGKKQACHMLKSNVWGQKDEIDSKNECVGRKQIRNKQQ